MDTATNQTKKRLAAGELALGMGARQARTVDIATVAKTCGFDWLFIDMEHSSMDVDLASQLAMASLGAGITPLVRVPGHEHYHASRLLDNGAQGIVAPHVDTVEWARRRAWSTRIRWSSSCSRHRRRSATRTRSRRWRASMSCSSAPTTCAR